MILPSINYIEIKELIQDDLKESLLKSEIKSLLDNDNHAYKMKADFEILKEKMGKTDASKNAAEAIYLQLSGKAN